MPRDYVKTVKEGYRRWIPTELGAIGLTLVSGTYADMFDDDVVSGAEFTGSGLEAGDDHIYVGDGREWWSFFIDVKVSLKSSVSSNIVTAKLYYSRIGFPYVFISTIGSTSSTSYVDFEWKAFQWATFGLIKIAVYGSEADATNYLKVRQVDVSPYFLDLDRFQLPESLTAAKNLKVSVEESLPAGTSILGKTYVTGGTETATVTAQGYLDVKTHTPEHCFAGDYADAQAAVVILTPTAGKKIKIIQAYVSTADDGTDVTLAFGTSGNVFFKLYSARKSAQTGNIICGTGATDETIKLTCGPKTFVSISYDEV